MKTVASSLPSPVRAHIDRILRLAQKGGVFPGAVLRVSRSGESVYEGAIGYADLTIGERVTADTVFDLASLTKPLATALAALLLLQKGALSMEETAGNFLPPLSGTDKALVTIRELLTHTGGLPDYRPYFKHLWRLPEDQRRDALIEWVAREPLTAPIGSRTIYSDLGFFLLQRVIESAAGMALDRFFRESVARPLGCPDLFFSNDRREMARHRIAATEFCPWRERLIRGEVHDENAYCLGGVGGHAGLFGTAAAVERLLLELLAAWHGRGEAGVFDPDVVKRFLKRPRSGGRALGFDVPGPGPSSSGRYFSFQTVGHLGFTGTSFWMDLERQILVVFLTNRVHPTRDNEKIRAFRPCLHDAVQSAMARC